VEKDSFAAFELFADAGAAIDSATTKGYTVLYHAA
jgi:hypothetical protein